MASDGVIGYVVLAKRENRSNPGQFDYTAAGSIWPDIEPVENHLAYCQDQAEYLGDPVEYLIGAIQVVTG